MKEQDTINIFAANKELMDEILKSVGLEEIRQQIEVDVE
jgi:hypothetical protein